LYWTAAMTVGWSLDDAMRTYFPYFDSANVLIFLHAFVFSTIWNMFLFDYFSKPSTIEALKEPDEPAVKPEKKSGDGEIKTQKTGRRAFGAVSIISMLKNLPEFVSSLFFKVSSHSYLNWHFVKFSALSKAVKEFGAASVDEQGRIYTNIYVLEKMPESGKGWNLKNTGVKINGSPLWASTRAGALVMFADGAEPGEIEAELNALVTDETRLRGSARISARLKNMLAAVKSPVLRQADISSMGFKPGIIIDHNRPAKAVTYDRQGSLVVSSDYFEGAASGVSGAIEVKLSELMTIRNAESVAMPQNIYINMDNIFSIKEFTANLEAFNAAGNGQMIVSPEIFSGLSDYEVRRIAGLARKSGVSLCVDLKDNGSRSAYYKEMGFDGYKLASGNETVIYNFTGGAEIRADSISGYSDADSLINKIRNSAEPCKILNLSEMQTLIKGADRDISDRIALTEVLKTAVLSFYNSNIMSREFVRDVAYAWDRDKLPVLTQDAGSLVKSLYGGDRDAALTAMGILGASHPVNAYLEKIKSDISGTLQEKELNKIQEAFLFAIAEKMLAKEKLLNAGAVNGLSDRNLEITLGRSLMTQKAYNTEAAGLEVTADNFMEQNNVNTEEFYARLNDKINQLGMRESEPRAINTTIELITQLAERKASKMREEREDILNAQSIKKVLLAA